MSGETRSDTPATATNEGVATIRPARATDRQAINQAVGRAFWDDPVAIYLFPDGSSRADRFGAFAHLAMTQFGDSGSTFVSDPVRGAAIWQGPLDGPHQVGVWTQMMLGLRFLAVIRGGIERSTKMMAAMEKNHPKDPHWYLATLGTEPEAQGQGIGSALITPILERCDKTRMPAYLESSKESNIPFYQKHGFDVTKEIRIAGGPMMWAMMRPPKS